MNIAKGQNTPSFQGLNCSRDMPELIKTTVEKSKAFAKFGQKYNADVDYVQLQSSTRQVHPALLISNIAPKGIQKLIDKIKGINGKRQFMYISTVGTKEQDLHKEIISASSDFVINKYRRAFKNKKQ